MVKNIRRKAGMAAVAATIGTGGLIAGTPSANASPAYGNCYNYGTPGYGDMFSGSYYTGNCYEWQLGVYHALPSYMAGQNKSLRSWGNGNPDFRFQVGVYSGHSIYYEAGTWLDDMGSADNLAGWVQ